MCVFGDLFLLCSVAMRLPGTFRPRFLPRAGGGGGMRLMARQPAFVAARARLETEPNAGQASI